MFSYKLGAEVCPHTNKQVMAGEPCPKCGFYRYEFLTEEKAA